MTPDTRAEIRWLLPIGLGIFALASMALSALPYFFAASSVPPTEAHSPSVVEAGAGMGVGG
jgi:hypothetical protein